MRRTPIEVENIMKVKHFIVFNILIIGFLCSSLGCANMFNFGKNKTRFDWVAQASAPKGYIMRIIDGTFYYHVPFAEWRHIESFVYLF